MRGVKRMMATVLKTVYGTDERCRREAVQMSHADGRSKPVQDATDALARRAEEKIERMNAATERLSRLAPASNLSEAIQQIMHGE